MVSTRYWSFPPNAQGEGEDVLQSPLCLPLGVSVFGLCRSHAEVAACPSDRSCDSGPLACPSRRLAVFFSFFFFFSLGTGCPGCRCSSTWCDRKSHFTSFVTGTGTRRWYESESRLYRHYQPGYRVGAWASHITVAVRRGNPTNLNPEYST